MLGKRAKGVADEVSTTLPDTEQTSIAAQHPTDSKLPPRLTEAEVSVLLGDLLSNSTDSAAVKPAGRWWLEVAVGEFNFRALYDTGCLCTVLGPIGLQLASTLGVQVTAYNGPSTRMENGYEERAVCQVELPFTVAGVTKSLTVLILVHLDCDAYLGSDFALAFNAVFNPQASTIRFDGVAEPLRVDFASMNAEAPTLALIGVADVSRDEQEQIKQLLDRVLPPADSKLGRTNLIEHEINVGDARPIKQRYYPVSHVIEDEMYDQVRKMLEEEIIELSTSAWSSPVEMVKKGDGSYRFCVDYRKVNAVTEKNAYPIPYMDVILRKLRRAKYISTIDLSQAYHQVPMKEESKPMTAFTVPGMGIFQFKRMPYGVTNGPATFQTLIDSLIGSDMEPHAFSYLDDIIIISESFSEH